MTEKKFAVVGEETAPFTPPRLDVVPFEGRIPRSVFAVMVCRIERVDGATALTRSKSESFVIRDGRIVRPDREPTRQFLVVSAGELLEFETDGDDVFIAGITTAGEGPRAASDLFSAATGAAP